MLPVVPPLFARFIVSAGDAPEMARLLTTIDIYAASLIVPHWTVVVTEAILAVIVMVMKGPACVADAYPLDTPTPRRDDDNYDILRQDRFTRCAATAAQSFSGIADEW